MAMGPIETYIRQAAIKRGIDPDVAVRVARSEGGLDNPFRHGEGPAPKGQDPRYGSLENSYGPFQLYVSGRGAGLGDRAMAAGIDPSKNWEAGVDFALDEVTRKGWGQWYGAKGQGITGMMGVNGNPAPVAQRPNATSPQMATDMASPGNPVIAAGRQDGGVQGPDMPPDIAAQQQQIAATDAPVTSLRKKLGKMMSGYSMPAVSKNDTALAGMAMPAAARVDTPEIAPFDQNQIANQRQNLAMAMQKLNSGKLWL
jgi:hypothetical protein